MAFKLRVVFTGICAFVPNERDDVDVRMCVILPEGNTNLPRVGGDGSPLKRHRGFIQLKVPQISGVPGSVKDRDADIIWYPDRHRITFNFVPASSRRGVSKLDFEDLERVASLEEMVRDFAAPDPDILRSDPPGTVLAQVLLHAGQLRPNESEERLGRWVFPRSFSIPAFVGTLTSEVIWEVPDLKEVELIATPFAGGKPTVWKLKAVDEEDVEIVIANLCDENPLRWDVREPRLEPDNDFRWYYTLLSNSAQRELLNDLGGLSFPIPMPALGSPNGEGRNCVPAVTGKTSYNMDSNLPGRSALSADPRVAQEGLEARLAAPEIDFTVGGLSSTEIGREYLVQIGFQASPMARALMERRSGYQGEMSLQVVDVRGTYTQVELTRLSLISPGMRTPQGETGKISISGLSGGGSLVRTGDRIWSLEARVKAQVLYRAVEEYNKFSRVTDGLYMPDFEIFEGTVRAELADPDGDGEMVASSGRLQLKRVSGGLGWIPDLSLPLQGVTFSKLSERAAALAARGRALNDCPGVRRLRVRPHAFKDDDSRTHSGTSWEAQLETARKIWGPCCIELDAEPLMLHDRPDLKNSDNLNRLLAAIEERNEERDLIEIILVDNALAADGGGATFSPTTALARIVISNLNGDNPNLLAHELGHVFGGLHPQDQKQEGFWVADRGTVLETGQPNPDRNSPNNCRRIRNAALTTTGNACCISA